MLYWLEESGYLLLHACLLLACLMSKPLMGLVMEMHAMTFVNTLTATPKALQWDPTPTQLSFLTTSSVHHVPEVAKSIQDVRALLIYLPPYLPDLNPIEQLFSKVRGS